MFELVDAALRHDLESSDSPRSSVHSPVRRPPLSRIARNIATKQAVADKVAVADAVERQDYFFPFNARDRPQSRYLQQDVFQQAILRDLDRLYIRIVDELQDYDAYRAIAINVRLLPKDFPLLEFEVATFHAVNGLDIELNDFEVFRGLYAWSQIETAPDTTRDRLLLS